MEGCLREPPPPQQWFAVGGVPISQNLGPPLREVEPEIFPSPGTGTWSFPQKPLTVPIPSRESQGTYKRDSQEGRGVNTLTPGADGIVHARGVPVDHSLPLVGPLVN